jgi:hypothetical protein
MILPRVTKIDSKTPEANIAGSTATGITAIQIEHRSGGSDQRCACANTVPPRIGTLSTDATAYASWSRLAVRSCG